MTEPNKPVTDEELAEWDDLETDYGGLQDFCIRLIAALREARRKNKDHEFEIYRLNACLLKYQGGEKQNEILDLKAKLAEIRAVVMDQYHIMHSALHQFSQFYMREELRRLHEVCGEPTDSNTRKPEMFLPE